MSYEKMSYQQLEKLSKNPFYTLSEKELKLLEEYRAKRYSSSKKHRNTFNKHGFIPNKHNVSLLEESNEQIN